MLFCKNNIFRDLEINWLFNLYSPNNSGYGGLIIKFAINKYICVVLVSPKKQVNLQNTQMETNKCIF